MRHEATDEFHVSRLVSKNARVSGLTSRVRASWPKVKLGEIAELDLGKMLDQKKNKGSNRKYLANINVRWGTFNLDDLKEMPFKDSELERYGLRYGDIVMCEGGEPGRCAIWKDQCPGMMYQKALHRIRPHEGIDHRFLYYHFLLLGRKNGFAGLFTGSTIKHMPKDKLALVEIPLPPLPVQRRIADILSAYDDLIENNRRRIAILEETARLTYRKWFNENRSLIASVRIGEFIELQNGFAFKSNTFVEAGQYKIITIKNVKDVIVDSGNVAFVNRIPERMPIHCRIHPRDILLSLTGNVGRVSIAIDHDGLLNQRVAKVKSDFPWCSLLFLTSNESFSLMNNLAVGAAQQNLSPVKLCDEFVEMPIRVKMAQIEKLVAPLFDQIVLLAQQNTTLAAARDMLLPRLMKGGAA